MKYDLSKARKNPYAERLKKGYSIRINVPPEDELTEEFENYHINDEELQFLKEFVAKEDARRERIKAG